MAKQRNMSHLVIFDYELHESQRFSNQNGKICTLHHWILLLISFIKLLSSITVNARLPGQIM